MITGFQAQMECDDAGTGAAVGGASTKFDGLVMFELPKLEASGFEATELNQTTDGTVVDTWEREEPTGLIKAGATKGEIKFTKANYNRLAALLGVKGHTYKLISPDDQTSGSAVKLTDTFLGWVSAVGEVKFEKKTPVSIPFEITTQRKHAFT